MRPVCRRPIAPNGTERGALCPSWAATASPVRDLGNAGPGRFAVSRRGPNKTDRHSVHQVGHGQTQGPDAQFEHRVRA